ncbi:MAG: hypothetical protein F4060_02035 [Holophagales bacterium]|nr:hypothetical protein [Holophagales bacterium]MYG30019.1 hypothetical protein [Holophagales bacterium]MYI78698.1 hypothetical protein [Holophagales bacterium]
MPDSPGTPLDVGSAGSVRLPLYTGFLLTGVVTVLLGPLLPELSREWSLPVEELAPLFVAQFLASAVGSLLSSYRQGLSLVVGYLLIAIGLSSLAMASWPLALAPVAAIGLGLGLAIPATNLRVAHAQPTRRGAALSSLNLVWGAGAVACPLAFAVRPRETSSDAVLWALAAAAGLVLVFLVRAPRSGEDRADVATAAASPQPAARGGPVLALAVVAAILFLYVGIENAVGGWLVSLADEFQPARSATSLWIGSGFWAALLGGRVVAPLLLRRMSERMLYGGGLAVAGAGLLGLLASGSQPGVALSAVAVGAGLAPLFPLTVSFLAELTASTRSRSTGWVFALAGTGGAVLPWLTARLAGGAERLAAGFVAPIAGLTLLALLFGLLNRLAASAAPHQVRP